MLNIHAVARNQAESFEHRVKACTKTSDYSTSNINSQPQFNRESVQAACRQQFASTFESINVCQVVILPS